MSEDTELVLQLAVQSGRTDRWVRHVIWEVCLSGQPHGGKWTPVAEDLSDAIEDTFSRLSNDPSEPHLQVIEDHAVDFRLLSISGNDMGHAKIGQCKSEFPIAKSKEAMRPMRRREPLVQSSNSDITHPKPGDIHPWYEWRVSFVESLGGANDWLTTDFFLRTFRSSMEQVGESISDDDLARLFSFQHNNDFRKRKPDLERRGGVLYERPHGWKLFALNIKGKYLDGDSWMQTEGQPGEWAVAYHGTKISAVPSIVKNGFRVGPNQHAAERKMVDSRTEQRIKTGVYVTPNLAVVECYANGEEAATGVPPITVDGHTLFFALQCRVRPGAIRRPKWSQHYGNTATDNDEEHMGIDGVYEWVIENPADIRPLAVLLRDRETLENQRNLFEIAEEIIQHMKPMPPGSFDHIPGKINQEEQEDAEKMQMRQMQRGKNFKASIRRESGSFELPSAGEKDRAEEEVAPKRSGFAEKDRVEEELAPEHIGIGIVDKGRAEEEVAPERSGIGKKDGVVEEVPPERDGIGEKDMAREEFVPERVKPCPVSFGFQCSIS